MILGEEGTPPHISFWEFQESGLFGSRIWRLEPGLAVSMASQGDISEGS